MDRLGEAALIAGVRGVLPRAPFPPCPPSPPTGSLPENTHTHPHAAAAWAMNLRALSHVGPRHDYTVQLLTAQHMPSSSMRLLSFCCCTTLSL